MTESSPSAETIRFVIEILSARATPLAELPQTIASISHAVARLGKAPDAAPPPVAAPLRPAAAVKRVRKAAAVPAPLARAVVPVHAVLPEPAAAAREIVPTVYPPARRRGRPRRIAEAPVAVEEAPVEEAAPPQPRLLRRADALANEPEASPEGQSILRATNGAVRGVVKWFDGRAGKGALRLTGISGDVMLDPTVLERSGIKRLYKDQEVEATVQETGGRVRLLTLTLPARAGEPALNIMPGEITGTLRRQPRSIQVEIKRDGIRQSAARAEAEQVLGGVGRIKANRRLTP